MPTALTHVAWLPLLWSGGFSPRSPSVTAHITESRVTPLHFNGSAAHAPVCRREGRRTGRELPGVRASPGGFAHRCCNFAESNTELGYLCIMKPGAGVAPGRPTPMGSTRQDLPSRGFYQSRCKTASTQHMGVMTSASPGRRVQLLQSALI